MTIDEPGLVLLGTARFDTEFRTASLASGSTIQLTRSESSVLKHLARQPGRVFSRDTLLNAISGEGSDKNDRNIDFVINRLRRKLKDDPKNPRFIATRYGEGYFWAAWPKDDTPLAAGAYAVVGPIRGLDQVGDDRAFAERFARQFRDRFARNFAADRKIVLDPDAPLDREAYSGDPPQITLELTFLTGPQGLECVFRATDFRNARLLCVMRRPLSAEEGDRLVGDEYDIVAADQVAAAVWENIANPPAIQQPVALSMHEASTAFTGELRSWRDSEQRLRAMLAVKPESAPLKLMLAFILHTKYVHGAHEVLMPGKDTRAADEDEMEAMVLAALPGLQEQPDYVIMAAKLLYFLDRGYRDMAVEMAERAFRESTAVESSLAIIGLMRAHEGEIEEGLRDLDLALEHAETGSRFQAYLLALKAQVLTAAGRWAAAAAVLQELHEKEKPGTIPMVSLLFADPDEPSETAVAVAESLTVKQAQGVLVYIDYIAARLYREETHRTNLLRGPARLLAKRFGEEVVIGAIGQPILMLFPEILTTSRTA